MLESVKKVTESLDYRYLNDIIDVPTDENIARYIWSQLGLKNIHQVGLQSQKDEGVDIDRNGVALVWRKFRFEAAHRLPNVPTGHKCGRMHGHGFEVIFHMRRKAIGGRLGVEYERINSLWKGIYSKLHHNCLNDIEGLENPTSELISRWIWNTVKNELPELIWITVYETASSGAHYDGCLLYTSPSPRDAHESRMPSSA